WDFVRHSGFVIPHSVSIVFTGQDLSRMQESLEGLDSLSLSFVEGLYADYLRDPESVSPDWRSYFEETSNGNGLAVGALAPEFRLGPSFRAPSLFSAPRLVVADGNGHAAATEQMNM